MPDVPRPAWWLPGPHLQTIFVKVFRGISMPDTTRETWRMSDGDMASIERVCGHPNAPRLVVFHGLEGGIHSSYARGLLHEAARRRWSADLALWRTCDGRLVNDVARSYHSGASDDLDEIVTRILARRPGIPTVLLGVSLGGNVLLKWLGERGTGVPAEVRAAVAVSAPFDLDAAARNLERGFSRVYARFFLRTMRRKALAKHAQFPSVGALNRIAAASTLREFDDAVTAPLHGFVDAADYYQRASSLSFLSRIRVPTLLLNAQNDPFLPPSVLDRVREVAAGNALLTCIFPPKGGHVGFVSGRIPLRPHYWMERFAVDWLARHVAP